MYMNSNHSWPFDEDVPDSKAALLVAKSEFADIPIIGNRLIVNRADFDSSFSCSLYRLTASIPSYIYVCINIYTYIYVIYSCVFMYLYTQVFIYIYTHVSFSCSLYRLTASIPS
jgi:hypothetical protein